MCVPKKSCLKGLHVCLHFSLERCGKLYTYLIIICNDVVNRSLHMSSAECESWGVHDVDHCTCPYACPGG